MQPGHRCNQVNQPCTHGGSSGGVWINNAQLLTTLIYATVANYQDPLSFQEAMGSEHANNWQDACQYKMDAMAKNKVWVLFIYHQAIRPSNLDGYSGTKQIYAITRGW